MDVRSIIDLVVDKAETVCYDKEINKKIKPFSMVYTMDVLGLTFQQKTVKVDMRKDDYFISQHDDEDPPPCKKDNISNDLCLNQDPKKLEAYQNSVSQKSAMLRSQKTLVPGNK